jgi:putative transposase
MKTHATFRSKKMPQYSSWPNLSDQDVHQAISKQLAQLIPDTIQGYKCDQSTVCDVVLKASVEGRAIEGTCNDLAAAPTGVTIRTYLNEVLPVTHLQVTERQLCAQLQTNLPHRLWRAPLSLAGDLHDEPFYGKTTHLRAYACRSEARDGTTWFYRVATVYAIHHGVPYTLALTFVLPEDTLVEVLKRLLQQVRGLGLQLNCLYLDKGFCVAPILEYLEKNGPPAILACAIRGKTGGTRALCRGQQSYFTMYTFAAGKYPAHTVRMAVVRTYAHKKGKRKAVWLLYVVIRVKVSNPQTIRARYRARFGIECSYRCMRQTHAVTTSQNPLLRFFLISVAFLLVNLWITLRWHFCQVPRRGGRSVNKKLYELQRQGHFLARVIEKLYGTVTTIQAQVEPLDP